MSAGTAASVSAATTPSPLGRCGTLAPLVSVVGGRLADRALGSCRAVSWGGILIVCGHYAMAVPAAGGMMWGWWIVGSHLLLGLGDILLETSGMPATNRLAPAAFAGEIMSLWFLPPALANGSRAQTVKLRDDVSTPAHFGVNGATAVVAGLAVTAATRRPRRTTHPVH